MSADGVDLARTVNGTALIGDPRNDENLVLAQLHLAFIKFHNALVDGLRNGKITDVFGELLGSEPPDEPPTESRAPPSTNCWTWPTTTPTLSAKAQQLTRWHYQWIVVHQYLPLAYHLHFEPGFIPMSTSCQLYLKSWAFLGGFIQQLDIRSQVRNPFQ